MIVRISGLTDASVRARWLSPLNGPGYNRHKSRRTTGNSRTVEDDLRGPAELQRHPTGFVESRLVLEYTVGNVLREAEPLRGNESRGAA